MLARLTIIAALLSLATPARAQIAQAEYAQRRAALAARLDDGVLVALGAPEPAHDYLTFHQSSPFLYLTGIREPGAAMVIAKRNGRVTTTLFVERRDPAQEVWSGARIGAERASELTGLPARETGRLGATLDSLLAGATRLYVIGDIGDERPVQSRDDQFVRALAAKHRSLRETRDVTPIVGELRGRKSDAEIELLRKSAAITVDAQREAMRQIAPGQNEFETQALIEYTFRRNGADRPSFATIVGSGPNSTTLHYNADDRFMEAGDVVVMDVGSSYLGYAADVTRTVPVSGTFTAEQRQIYQIVRDAQAAAERQLKPGAPVDRMRDSATAVIAAGLTRLGLIESPTATFECETGGARGSCPQYFMYYMHGLGHGIGLDVHDPEQYYVTGKIEAGSAFTIEPGIYVRANLLEILADTDRNRAMIAKIRPAVQRFANIGIRIEDDYIVTDRGVEWISKAPREIDEVEALMREEFAGPMPRDSTKVNWYKRTR